MCWSDVIVTLMSAPDQELKGVHIFRAGKYTLRRADGTNEVLNYSEDDVKQIADNANALIAAKKHDAPAKLGHDDDQAFAHMAGLPAVGWTTRVVAKGKDLFADFSQVPALLAEAIKRGRYKKVSSEIYDPEQTATNFGDIVKGFTLRAVAFLGADVPVVKGMNPLMLASGASGTDGGHVITLEVSTMSAFSESKEKKEEMKALMVPANRHQYGALCKMDEDEEAKRIDAIHPDGSYDASDLHNPEKKHKRIGHDRLKLLSEQDIRILKEKTDMADTEAVKLAEQKAAEAQTALAAEQEKVKALQAQATETRINAFAEKFKGLLKQPAILATFKALAKGAPESAVKLSEGKEASYLDGLMAFAESLITAKPVLFGELAPVVKEGEVAKSGAVKLAEQEFEAYAETHGNPGIAHTEVALAARALFSENPKVSYREHLLAEAKKRMGKFTGGQYAEIEGEVA